MIELYRAMIPRRNLINDNHGTHYNNHMGNLKQLSNQFNRILNHEEFDKENVEFYIPSLDDLKDIKYPIGIRCEVWRCRNNKFDPQNYAKTFKAPIDLLVTNGYIQDDHWRFIKGITYSGGGPDVWKERAFRYKDDKLPEDMYPDWWNKYSDDYGDILIRIMIEGS